MPLADIPSFEAVLFRIFDKRKPLMNGDIPQLNRTMPRQIPEPAQTVQVMSDEDIRVRREPALRLPRQIEHIGRLVDYILNVKDLPLLRRSLAAHFDRLDAYRAAFLQQGPPVIRAEGEPDDE